MCRAFEQKQKEKLSIPKKDESNIHKEPLKDSTNTNSGLKRSHSSPNLVQVKKLKVLHHVCICSFKTQTLLTYFTLITCLYFILIQHEHAIRI